MQYVLHPPAIITGRLMPGFQIEGDFVSVESEGYSNEGREAFKIYFDIDGKEYVEDGLQTGCQGGEIHDVLATVCNFLGAAAESYRYQMSTGEPGENIDLFCPPVVGWAYQHSDELSILGVELEERSLEIKEKD